ncbi:hypothetical protein PS627_04209 [Pseudomonas fluorescens]|uniref:hypothetical protein n=1 Tax=Pseudomonas fluorescens TaxID=294 RepID=UPI00125BB421|nr:hypothetical protein [Pseudomonas fluorescens]CAG8870943.1 hypothetical protein PS627_04209 [Pseudomonas fluorescens]VVP79588.1 hypothetical protein PS910_01823 [Pseudomonas fluorescens]
MDDSAWQFYRSAGTLMIAPVDLGESDVQDILDSILFAQLAAGKQHDPFNASLLWRKAWKRTLDALHWTVTASSGQEEVLRQGFTMASLLSPLLGPLPSQDLAALFGELSGAHLHALEPFCRRRHAETTQLRLTLCLAHSAEQVSLASVAFDAHTPLEPNWLTQLYPATSHQSLCITRTSHTYMRPPDYAAERAKVIELLGMNRIRELERIPLAPHH